MSQGPSDRSRAVALALAVLLGPFGGHRFYVGKNGTGALMAISFGGLGLWWLYDLILIGTGSFRDAEDRLVLRWETEAELARSGALPPATFEELEQLRAEVAEIQERLDFTERLLARPSVPRSPLDRSPLDRSALDRSPLDRSPRTGEITPV